MLNTAVKRAPRRQRVDGLAQRAKTPVGGTGGGLRCSEHERRRLRVEAGRAGRRVRLGSAFLITMLPLGRRHTIRARDR